MIKHIVMWTLKEEALGNTKMENGLKIKDMLETLKDELNEIIEMEDLFIRALTSSAVYPRVVIWKVLDKNAAALIFVHNHPSGNHPSKEDISITKKLMEVASAIDVQVHDHIIIAGNGFYSFADHDLI